MIFDIQQIKPYSIGVIIIINIINIIVNIIGNIIIVIMPYTLILIKYLIDVEVVYNVAIIININKILLAFKS